MMEENIHRSINNEYTPEFTKLDSLWYNESTFNLTKPTRKT
jgi:hypothetical protein